MSAELKRLFARTPRRTLAVAESLTAGNLQAQIAAVSGASEYFLGGITAYTLEQKVKHLGVDRAAAVKVNCVSAEVAEQMAKGACRLFGSDYALATTGYAEPVPANHVDAPFAWWALADARDGKIVVRSGRVAFPGLARVEVQQRVAAAVIAELVKYLGPQ